MILTNILLAMALASHGYLMLQIVSKLQELYLMMNVLLEEIKNK